MSSESGQRLSMEELQRRNPPPYPVLPIIQAAQSQAAQKAKQDWEDLLTAVSALYRLERINSDRLNRLETSVSAQEALLRALTRQAGQLPSQAQMEALTRDVAQIQATLKQAGKKRERRFSLPRIRLPKLHLPYISWSRLLLGLTALSLTGGVLWVVWFSWEKLWSAAQTLLP